MPAACAGAVAASHARQTSVRNPSPGPAGLGELLVAAVAVEADRRARHQSTGGRSVVAGQRLGQERRALRRGSRGSGASARRSTASRRCPRRRGGRRRRGPRGPAASIVARVDVPARRAPGAAAVRHDRAPPSCPSASERAPQGAADEAARPGDGDAHDPGLPIGPVTLPATRRARPGTPIERERHARRVQEVPVPRQRHRPGGRRHHRRRLRGHRDRHHHGHHHPADRDDLVQGLRRPRTSPSSTPARPTRTSSSAIVAAIAPSSTLVRRPGRSSSSSSPST